MEVITIIATKNRFELLKKAVTSVLDQTERVDRFIVVSDSNDETYALEQEYLKDFPCELIRDIYTHNYAGNLNSSIEHLLGKYFSDLDFDNTYIAFLDDDDIWDVDYICECKKVASQKDFVVTGLRCKRDDGTFDLDIPTSLDIQSFLRGNPGIQGSNTFIRLSKLLEAGCFDENMSSTTDRDLFTRVMMVGATYAVVPKHLVYVEACNNRQRITNTKNIKLDGLAKFYYKYQNMMNDTTRHQFFERAKVVFGFDEIQIKEHILTIFVPYNGRGFSRTNNKIKDVIIERKNMLDKAYGSFSSVPEFRQAVDTIDSIRDDEFSNFNNAKYIETPLFGIELEKYYQYTELGNDAEKYFLEVYNNYIDKDNEDAIEWLNNVSRQFKGQPNDYAISLISNAIMETYKTYGINYNRVFYYDKYILIIKRLVARLLMNEYRIKGLKSICNEQYEIIDPKSLVVAFDEIEIKGTFDYIRKQIEAGRTMQQYNENKTRILELLKTSDVDVLGCGSEGIVFTDYKKIYKWFPNAKDGLYDYLTKASKAMKGSKYTYDFVTMVLNGEVILSYDYMPSNPIQDITFEELEDFVNEMKDKGIVIDNIKKDNFRRDANGLKYIDYGFSIKQYDDISYEKSLARAKQLASHIDKDDLYFYKLINEYYVMQGRK